MWLCHGDRVPDGAESRGEVTTLTTNARCRGLVVLSGRSADLLNPSPGAGAFGCYAIGMLARRQRLFLWGLGAVSGLALGLTYWYAWGCRRCAEGNHPVAIVGFFVVVGAVLARAWGPDHLKRRAHHP